MKIIAIEQECLFEITAFNGSSGYTYATSLKRLSKAQFIDDLIIATTDNLKMIK